MRSTTRLAAALGAGALLALAAPMAANAHVTVTPGDAPAGGYAVLDFAFSHGCDGSPTTGLVIDIPEGVESVAPALDPAWTIEKSLDGERVSQLVYTAGTPVEDGFRSSVEVQIRVPDDAAGSTLEFPVLQQCAEGETAWNETAEGGEEPVHPAPAIVVTEAVAGGHSGSHGGDAADAADDTTADAAAGAPADVDVLARVLGILGLVVGAVGIVIGVTARRGAKA